MVSTRAREHHVRELADVRLSLQFKVAQFILVLLVSGAQGSSDLSSQAANEEMNSLLRPFLDLHGRQPANDDGRCSEEIRKNYSNKCTPVRREKKRVGVEIYRGCRVRRDGESTTTTKQQHTALPVIFCGQSDIGATCNRPIRQVAILGCGAPKPRALRHDAANPRRPLPDRGAPNRRKLPAKARSVPSIAR